MLNKASPPLFLFVHPICWKKEFRPFFKQLPTQRQQIVSLVSHENFAAYSVHQALLAHQKVLSVLSTPIAEGRPAAVHCDLLRTMSLQVHSREVCGKMLPRFTTEHKLRIPRDAKQALASLS